MGKPSGSKPSMTLLGGMVAASLLAALPGASALAQEASAPQAASPAIAMPLSDASARLGFDLLGRVAKANRTDANPVVSPASLGAAFALLDLGASPKFHLVLQKTLRLDATKDGDLAALRQALGLLIAGNKTDGPLTGVSAVYFDPQVEPAEAALAALKQTGALVEVKDLADPATIEAINAAVKEHTKGLIPSILDKPLKRGGLVVLNALHFKDDWQRAFEPARTTQVDFHLANGKTAQIPLMHGGTAHQLFREQDRFIAVSLPYETKGYALTVITTKEKPAALAEFAPVAGWLAGQGFAEEEGTVALPRFSLNAGGDLLASLDKLGLKPARLSPQSLSQFSAKPQAIDQIIQKVVLTVDEKGTEAAAATAVTTNRSLSVPPTKAFVADKPFLFALRDETSGQILIAGYIGDASKAQ